MSELTKSCTWIYEGSGTGPDRTGLVGTFEINLAMVEGNYKIITFDSIEQKWIVYKNNPTFLEWDSTIFIYFQHLFDHNEQP